MMPKVEVNKKTRKLRRTSNLRYLLKKYKLYIYPCGEEIGYFI